MKTFSQIREAAKVVSQGRVGKTKYTVQQTARGYEVHIDGDKLDRYKDKRTAEKMAKEFISQLGK